MQSQARRTDWVTAEIVEKGIRLQGIAGTKFAAEYLNLHQVSFDVTVRILTRPWERRNQSRINDIAPLNRQLDLSAA